MKIKLLSIFVLFCLVLFAIPCYSQTQMISITDLKYTNGSAIPTGTPIRIAEGGTVSVTFNLGINNPGFALIQGGTLSVYSKLNSSTTIQYVSIVYGQNAISGSVSRQCTIELKSSHFPSGTGSIYAQFSPINNSPILGTSVPVKTVPLITSNYIIGNQTVYQGDPVGSINGPTPNGGDGLYTYAWQQKIGSAGAWTNISGATSVTFQPTNLSVSTISYRRIVTSLFGTLTHTSNEITVTILPNIPIENNIITLNGNTISGSLPTGGTGTYSYSWVVFIDEEPAPDGFILQGENGQNLEIPSWLHNEYWEAENTKWRIYISRSVTSGNKSLNSNMEELPLLNSNRMASNSNIESDLSIQELTTVYPNPTSEKVNFAINFSTDKEIDIVIYSDKLKNEKSVFRGIVAPNQVVNWNIPAGYQKGLYYYKILSGNKEVKSGKIIIQ